jgi:lysosomal acid lipase/cholesteryl ester hydrolase
MGQFDLPAMIDYVLQKTGQSKLHYIGHSQGTTAFFVMASIKPQYNSKIKAMHAYSPEVFLSNMKSPLMKMIAPKMGEIEV